MRRSDSENFQQGFSVTSVEFDVAFVSDFRLPGGSTASIAEEIRAHAHAGYSTCLIHIPAYERDRPIHAKIRACIDDGLATLIGVSDHARARLVTIRPPKVVEDLHPQLARISAELALVIVNQVPSDGANKVPYYDVRKIASNLHQKFGKNVYWAPIGPLARAAMKPHRSAVNVADWDWHNIIDVDAWTVERTAFVSSTPVIGRHSRPDKRKWPETPERIFEVYPDNDQMKVKVLGGEDILPKMLGSLPKSWTVYPFDTISPKAFLSEIDFYVYYHHSGLREAFGRGILEAISSGAVVILPPHFRELFGDACVYAKPADVRQTILTYYGNFALYQEQSRRGIDFARGHFGQDVHVNRLRRLIRSPISSTSGPVTPIDPSVMANAGGQNGRLTRIKSIARRFSGDN